MSWDFHHDLSGRGFPLYLSVRYMWVFIITPVCEEIENSQIPHDSMFAESKKVLISFELSIPRDAVFWGPSGLIFNFMALFEE